MTAETHTSLGALPMTSAASALDTDLRARPIDVVVLAERGRRVVFGACLSVGALALAIRLLATPAAARARWPDAWEIILISWFVAMFAWVAAGPLIRHALRQTRLDRGPRATDEWQVASLVVPTIGLSLLLPLSLHMPFAMLVAGEHGFENWAAMSVVVVGHAHLVLAFLGARRAVSLIREEPAASPGTIYLVTIVASAVPFGVFYAIPPILVAVTGIPILALLHAMESTLSRERVLLTDF